MSEATHTVPPGLQDDLAGGCGLRAVPFRGDASILIRGLVKTHCWIRKRLTPCAVQALSKRLEAKVIVGILGSFSIHIVTRWCHTLTQFRASKGRRMPADDSCLYGTEGSPANSFSSTPQDHQITFNILCQHFSGSSCSAVFGSRGTAPGQEGHTRVCCRREILMNEHDNQKHRGTLLLWRV